MDSKAISPYNSPMNASSEKPGNLAQERKFTSTLFPSLKPGVEIEKSKVETRSQYNSSKKNTENLVIGVVLDEKN